MIRRVGFAIALLSLCFVLNVPTASAAVREGDPRLDDRIVKIVRKVLKPLTAIVHDDNPEHKPTPPKP